MPATPEANPDEMRLSQMKRLLKKDNSLKYLEEIDTLNKNHNIVKVKKSQSPLSYNQQTLKGNN